MTDYGFEYNLLLIAAGQMMGRIVCVYVRALAIVTAI